MATIGHLDSATHNHIMGWACDADAAGQPISIVLTCDGQVIARVLADRHRSDIEQAGIGDGHHGFHVLLSQPLSPLVAHSIAARCEHTGVHLQRSPCVLPPAPTFDRVTQDCIAQHLAAPADREELRRRLLFLSGQVETLRQRHADAQSGSDERRNRRQRMWSEPGVGNPAAAAGIEDRPRALVIDDRVPLAAHDAGSNAVLSHMRSLQRLGYAVTFAPANLHGDEALLAGEAIGCCLAPWYSSIEEVLRRQRDSFALVYLHRVTTAARYVALARDHQPRARIVYSVADLHHLRLGRQAEIEQRPELVGYGEHVRLTELAAAWQSDAVITHSTAEAAVLRRHMHADRVHVVLWNLAAEPTMVPFAERRGFAFIGGYGHQPNVDAALWLVDRVLPELSAQGSEMPCLLAGSDMPEQLRGLRRHGVDPVGFVPSLSTLFDRVRLTVAPLAYGAGVKGKVLDSLAAGVPCACTPAAVEGLDLPDVLMEQVGTTAAELAAVIRRLHGDEALNQSCREAGLRFVAERMSEGRIDALMGIATGQARRP